MRLVREKQPYYFTDYGQNYSFGNNYSVPKADYSWGQTAQGKTRNIKNLVRPKQEIGGGFVQMLYTENPWYGSGSSMEGDLTDTIGHMLDTDRLGIFFRDSVSNHIVGSFTFDDYPRIYVKDNNGIPNTLEAFQQNYLDLINYGCPRQAEVQDIFLWVTFGCVDPFTSQIANNMVSTGFISWIENMQGKILFKVKNGITKDWLRSMDYCQEIHIKELPDSFGWYWDCP